MCGGVKDWRVAVGEGERLGDRAFREAGGFGQNRSGRVLVEVAIVPGAENSADIENLEQVELDIANVGDVMAQDGSLHMARLDLDWDKCPERGETVRNRN